MVSNLGIAAFRHGVARPAPPPQGRAGRWVLGPPVWAASPGPGVVKEHGLARPTAGQGQNQYPHAKELPGGQGAYGRGSGSGGLVVPHALHPVDQPRQYTPHFGKPYGYGGAFGRGGTPDWGEELLDIIHMMHVIYRMLKAGGVVRRQGMGDGKSAEPKKEPRCRRIRKAN